MRRSDIVELMADRVGVTKGDTAALVKVFFDVLGESLAAGHNIELRGFGVFKSVTRKARLRWNFQKAEKVLIPAHKTVVFCPSVLLKERMNSGT